MTDVSNASASAGFDAKSENLMLELGAMESLAILVNLTESDCDVIVTVMSAISGLLR